MVQKTQVVLLDDIDGTEGDETVTFSLDGVSYEIDLTSAHASELRESFSKWIGHGRKAGPKAAGRAAGPRRGRTDRAQLQKIREWARENGHEVNDRGRIPARILEAYEAAH
ncbi:MULTISPECIES: Lsr2 family protein [unclassified Isoptericola]|uniref:histone-like nucleoid-structuring protein Lsr2 n=1 Tax=unclassified Isoptericola TaxID=2623355 RepID=UPI002713D8E9|nr:MULTISPECIES: Lsr2 family protein [unclassified Isoptericola]MDO8143874.1 Lsr2 family protein [Isoptericola sp. 178]MDO8149298.1 Lsr2 family protein [Isoptericola sp. b515]MDO8152237.1 Lsr2 family protein [Isoptericola sp. b408]